jgi:two-component system phosphate regulon sensor histidine kinase PhoR
MKNRFVYLAVEAIAICLIVTILVCKFQPSAGITALIYILIMAVMTAQVYFLVVIPFSKKLKEMESTVEENRKLEQMRKEFVANVSHELKTPLTSISGFIETLQAGASEDPEIRTKFIDIIAIETARLKRLIEDLLVLSDIENKRDIDEKKFSISTSIENTTNTLNLIAEEKNIELILDLDDSLYIKGSADRFGQMMVNLIENAIKYSEPGGRVWVKSQDTGDSIEVSVKDEGIGIAPEHHDRLFERFYRVDKSRSKKVGGTGLGLSIVKHIAMLFDAKLRVESQIGEGTTFYVTFMKDEEKEHNT